MRWPARALRLSAVCCAAAASVAVSCGGVGPEARRISAIEQELRLLLPDASRRLSCDERRLQADILLEEAGRRTWRVSGCDVTAPYVCEERRSAGEDAVSCRHARSQTPIAERGRSAPRGP